MIRLASILFLALTLFAINPSEARANEPANAAAQATGVAMTIEGVNYCMGCTLKSEKGAAAQCSIYGHRHGLKVTKATKADGTEVASLVGKTLHYLDNDASKGLVGGEHHGETVTINATVFRKANTVQVNGLVTP